MHESFSQKARRFLDTPISKKGILFWVLSPLFFILSLFIFIFSFFKRKISYQNNEILRQNPNIKIICIGNILIGGSGKSPLVQKISLYFLNHGYNVAIASRGIGKNIKKYYACSRDQNKNLSALSDENREQFEFLKTFKSSQESLFYVLQNGNRIDSINYLINELKNKKADTKPTLIILDDGLQHFACPRNINMCVWSNEFLLSSPLFCMPIGPYREGMGKFFFRKLLTNFEFRVWSRTRPSELHKFKNNVKNALSKFNLNLTSQDLFISYTNLFWKVDLDSHKTLISISPEYITKKYLNQKGLALLTGIAHPLKLQSDLEKTFDTKILNMFFLDDHGSLTIEALCFIEENETLITTTKDYFRWCDNLLFIKAIQLKNVILCSLDVKIFNENLTEYQLENILKLGKQHV